MASYFTTSRNFSINVNVIYWIINGISYILNFIFSKVANLKIDNSSLYCHSYITANKCVTFDSTLFFFFFFQPLSYQLSSKRLSRQLKKSLPDVNYKKKHCFTNDVDESYLIVIQDTLLYRISCQTSKRGSKMSHKIWPKQTSQVK